MMANWKIIHLGILIALALLISACGAPLLKAENPLIKADTALPATDIPPTYPPTEILSPTVIPEQTPETEETRSQDMITITLVFDNYPYKPGLETAWGFSAFITYQDQNVLFDTGAMAALGINPTQIQNVVLSHEHSDHTGGMQALVSAGGDPKIYLPSSFSAEFKNYYGSRMYTIGEMSGPPPEQALVIDTTKGLVVITGCAHPGIEDIVLRAKQEFKEDIYLVLGGFHLGNASASQINEIIKEFNRIGVKYVAPCHCTGEQAISKFRNAFGEDFIQVGVGKVIEIEN